MRELQAWLALARFTGSPTSAVIALKVAAFMPGYEKLLRHVNLQIRGKPLW
jgi:hypothetical protein